MRLAAVALLGVSCIVGVVFAQPKQEPQRVGGNIKPPQKVKHVNPEYPPIAQSARVQGIVIIEATLDASGSVSDATVIRSIPLLDEAALTAVRQWRFTPTLLAGVPVPVIMTVTVQFSLVGKDDPVGAPSDPVGASMPSTAAPQAAGEQWPGVPDALIPRDRARSYIDLATQHWKAGRFTEARLQLNAASTMEPDSPIPLLLLALVWERVQPEYGAYALEMVKWNLDRALERRLPSQLVPTAQRKAADADAERRALVAKINARNHAAAASRAPEPRALAPRDHDVNGRPTGVGRDHETAPARPSSAGLPGLRAPGTLAVLGSCNGSPNYINSSIGGGEGGSGTPRLRRWASFPVTYSVDSSDVPADVRKLYDDVGVVARDLWSIATGDRIGLLRQVSGGGQIRVRVVPYDDGRRAAGTAALPLNGDVITSAIIELERFQLDSQLMGIGQQRIVMQALINVLGHEIGHALGIDLHSPNDGDLMSRDASYEFSADDKVRDPRSYVTTADRNTMLHAYCR